MAGSRSRSPSPQRWWNDIESIPPSKSWQDVRGRAHDVLFMGSLALRAAMKRDRNETLYKLTMHVGRKSNYIAKIHVGPGDDGRPVVTIMRPDED